MANSVTARFNDDCKVFVSMSDDTTVEKAVIIDAEGNETDIGGGGESDFSTAEVTVINNIPDNPIQIYTPTTLDDEEENLHTSGFDIYVDIGETVTSKVILYKGKALGYLPADPYGSAPTVVCTGDIINDDGTFTISGTGTISVSPGGI